MTYSTRLGKLIQDYVNTIRSSKDADLAWLEARASLAQVIELAAMARTRDGKCHPYHRRLKASAMGQGRDLLLSCQDTIGKCETFDDPLDLVETLVLPIPGLGELYAYDIAFRIGTYVRTLPDKVYLHARTRHGAKVLGLDPKRRAIKIDEFPPGLRSLKPHEAEDFLCIYKDQLAGRHTHSCSRRRTTSRSTLGAVAGRYRYPALAWTPSLYGGGSHPWNAEPPPALHGGCWQRQ
jgi:hypothetical protein